jgi:hypothetical protein
LNRWIQRTFEILASGFNYTDNVSEMFANDDLTSRFELPEKRVPITDVDFKDHEVILPKTQKSEFNLGNINLSDINVDFFKKRIKNGMFPPINSIYDVVLTDYFKQKNTYILLKESQREYVINSDGIYLNNVRLGKPIITDIKDSEEKNTYTNKEGKVITEIIKKYYRIDNNGNRMYEVSSPDFQVFRDNFGNEIIYESLDNIKSLINSSKKQFPITNVNDQYSGNIYDLYSSVLKTNLNDENKTYLRRKFELLKKYVDKPRDMMNIMLIKWQIYFTDRIKCRYMLWLHVFQDNPYSLQWL